MNFTMKQAEDIITSCVEYSLKYNAPSKIGYHPLTIEYAKSISEHYRGWGEYFNHGEFSGTTLDGRVWRVLFGYGKKQYRYSEVSPDDECGTKIDFKPSKTRSAFKIKISSQ